MKFTDEEIEWLKSHIEKTLRLKRSTGQLFWKINRRKVKAGTAAGTVMNNGYRYIHFSGQKLFGKTLVVSCATVVYWLVKGEWLDNLDHKNRRKLDSRACNLRPATRSEQNINRETFKSNRSGIKGVHHLRNGNWRAVIARDHRSVFLGDFSSRELAGAARQGAERVLFGNFRVKA